MLRVDCLSKVTHLRKTGGQAKVDGYLEAHGRGRTDLRCGRSGLGTASARSPWKVDVAYHDTSSSQWLKRERP